MLTALANQVAPLGEITAIRAERGNALVFTLADGSEIVKRWQDRSRSESWTDEMREQARHDGLQKKRERRQIQADEFSGFLFAIYSLDTLPMDFDPALWTATVDHVTVHADGRLVFKFHNGAEITETLQ